MPNTLLRVLIKQINKRNLNRAESRLARREYEPPIFKRVLRDVLIRERFSVWVARKLIGCYDWTLRGSVSTVNVLHAKIIWRRNNKRYLKDAGKIERGPEEHSKTSFMSDHYNQIIVPDFFRASS